MNAARREADGISVVVPTGHVDSDGAAQLETFLRAAVSSGNRCLVVDMSTVDYIGSKGLQALISTLMACRQEGGDLKLAGVSPDVMHVLRLTQFDRLFRVCASVERAIDDFGARVAPGHDPV